jgi:hypothetical protein
VKKAVLKSYIFCSFLTLTNKGQLWKLFNNLLSRLNNNKYKFIVTVTYVGAVCACLANVCESAAKWIATIYVNKSSATKTQRHKKRIMIKPM